MGHHDIITMGGSSGAIDVFKTIVGGLPRDLPASVFVVLHLAPGALSVLADILDREGHLPVVAAQDGERFRPGTVYVAPPDFHLLLEAPDHILLRRGPVENMVRPAIDPLFRSAACAFGPRVVGVVVSGALNDGTAGLDAIRRCGGKTVVQSPHEAPWEDMPRSAVESVEVDHVAEASEIASLLARLATEPAGEAVPVPPELAVEARISAQTGASIAAEQQIGEPALFSCPDCGGPLWQVGNEPVVRFRCHVGHAYSDQAMLAAQSESLERALWSALRGHRERSTLLARMADNARQRGQEGMARSWERKRAEYERHAEVIQRTLLTEGNPVEEPGGEPAGSKGPPVAEAAMDVASE